MKIFKRKKHTFVALRFSYECLNFENAGFVLVKFVI